MVHQDDEVDDDWEVLEDLPPRPMPRGTVVTSPSLARVEDDFFLVDGDISCDSDLDITPRQTTARDPSPVVQVQEASALPAEPTKSLDQGETSDGSSTTVEEDPSYRCQVCKLSIFKGPEILSANYHAQTSPGYLLSSAHNIQVSLEKQTAVYTTGRYTIQEVSCKQCSAVLGVTYSAAADARNQYKVGKFLVGRDRLALPTGVVHPMDSPRA
mmetsp:Transcript_72648/g.151653  ORF Transcript_72648/g.151653 Transcript_72648/m.151653 type:complete len:213 (+) Transcript_72648:136-774(+)|eukprot:CAMPEP_0206459172 /NCGR_PEP_ID=MMETSP0324_2-20121206/24019_1 /ASSEMBLY_ACC=CAM_ASM_000836 /TAXON_ID=2866 /ORGANISM="Crypthecodinium cohnii, Strain Seligo" /LENGTH=212 /DNA_ID=CAMNT_0053930675 /DNA_START=135 /DNA_END=773 /DNA_ORIENTATION=+